MTPYYTALETEVRRLAESEGFDVLADAADALAHAASLQRRLDESHEVIVTLKECADAANTRAKRAEDEIERLRKALERAGEAIHSEYCTQKHNPECEAVTTALAHETGAPSTDAKRDQQQHEAEHEPPRPVRQLPER